MIVMRRFAAAAALLFSIFSPIAAADDAPLPQPRGLPILTITGAIAKPNQGSSALLDAAMFAALPRQRLVTSTPWYDTPRTFEGPLLRDLLAAVGAHGRVLRIDALNDYAASVPATDAFDFDILVADRIDGTLIPVRERGPLFLIYPFDQVPELNTEQYYQRSVWQIRSIEVQP